MAVAKKVNIVFNGKKRVVEIEPEINSSLYKTAAIFGIDSNLVDAFFIENVNTRVISPLSIDKVEFGSTYNLLVRYKPSAIQSNENYPNTNFDHSLNTNGGNMQDAEYFSGYANLSIHRTMLRDQIRTFAYKIGIEESATFLKGKTVLDVGTGTGVLSIFCAKTGAKEVYSVDASSIANEANQVIAANNLSDKIFVLEGKIEEINLPCSQVDCIVSEWMGSMLLFESMLFSVISARDRYLSEDGIMLPSKCDMLIAPLDLSDYIEENLGFWGNVYDINMSVLREKARSEFFGFPIFTRVVQPSEMLCKGKSFFSFDTKYITEKDLDNILSTFSFVIERPGKIHGFACWFDVTFLNTVLSTSPEKPETHWKQTMLVFDDYPEVGEGTAVNGLISISRSNVWGRHYEVILKYWLEGVDGYYQKKVPFN